MVHGEKQKTENRKAYSEFGKEG